MSHLHLSRRSFLQSSALTLGLAAVPIEFAEAQSLEHRFFQHGVASGDPTPTSVIIWTRVSPTPEAIPGSGLGPDTTVTWEVSASSDFSTITRRGTATTSATSDHTIHIDVTSLEPARRYYYRFIAPNGEISTAGITSTSTLFDEPLSRLRFALASCANWEAGYFAAYGDIARLAQAGELDVLIFLGDYIYEYARGMFAGKNGAVRDHEPAWETVSLADYRVRYGHYRSDTQLQAAHAALPWIAMWDDHETANDAWREGAQNHSATEGDWPTRKAAGFQAYLEWMPIRATSTLFRSFQFGDLATLSILDLRSFRDLPPTYQQWAQGQRATTMMGTEQFQWLKDTVESTTTAWNIIGSSVMFAPMQLSGAPLAQLPEPLPANLDQWDGYSQERDRLLSILAGTGLPTLFLAGDIHAEWANSIRFNNQEIGMEVVCSSITSANVDDFLHTSEDNPVSLNAENFIRANSPLVRHVDVDSHGYSTVILSREAVQATWHRVADLSQAASPVSPMIQLEWKPGQGFTS